MTSGSKRSRVESGSRVLGAAAEAYYWKPGTAWFRGIELAQYEHLGVELVAPVLDLGCGDGRVAWMLRRLGRLGGAPIGTDFALGQLQRARKLGLHRALVRSDGGRLPFDDAVFRGVLCNGVLCSIPHGYRSTLNEIHRVLAPGGQAVITVPTDRFNDVLLWPRLLGRVSPALRSSYARSMDARQQHFWMLAPDAWRREAVEAGLEVAAVQPFFGPGEGRVYSLLYMHALRFLGVLRTAVPRADTRRPAAVVERLLRRRFDRADLTSVAAAEAGYVLLWVRRP